MTTKTMTAILLAGSRPGIDPLAAAASVAVKALVPICGRPMIDYVARALVDHPRGSANPCSTGRTPTRTPCPRW